MTEKKIKKLQKARLIRIILFMFVVILAMIFFIVMANADVNTTANYTFSVSPSSMAKTIPSQSFGLLDTIYINSTCNETMNLTLNYYGNATQFLMAINSTQVKPNTTLSFLQNYFVPPNIIPGNYYANISFQFNTTIQNVSLNMSLYDNLPPTFSRCEVQPTVQNITHNISISCFGVTDNVNVSSVYAFVNSSTQALNLTKVGSMDYSGNFSTSIVGNYIIQPFAMDQYGNIANYTNISFEFVGWKPFTLTTPFFGKIRYNQTHSRSIGYMEEEGYVGVTLTKLGYTDNMTGNIIVSVNSQQLAVNQTSNMSMDVGNITLSLTPDTQHYFEGQLKFTFLGQDYYLGFNANSTWYTIPPTLQTSWFGNQVICTSLDAGNYENSTRVCTLYLPIDTEISDKVCVFPLQICNSYNPQTIIDLEKSKERAWGFAIFGWSMVGLLIIVICVILYKNYW